VVHTSVSTSAPLDPKEAARLVDFARACKGAARAVVLYPEGHAAIAATLNRIVDLTSPASLASPMTLTVLPDNLALGDHSDPRPDTAIVELAELLHGHRIGQITVHPGGTPDAWHRFLRLLGRAPDSLRAEGGVSRVWTAMAGRHVELREIDYVDALREREGAEPADWASLVRNCLEGQASAAALIRAWRSVIDQVSATDPDRVETVLREMASAVDGLSPEMLLGVLEGSDDPQLVDAVMSRISDGAIARFVARNVSEPGATPERLARAVQVLAPERHRQQRVLSRAREEIDRSPAAASSDVSSLWQKLTEQLATTTDGTYGRELSDARARAVDVEEVSDDPPERIAAWLGTVSPTALRALDLTLVLDLLRIDQDGARWATLMNSVNRLLEDLLLVGDFDAARKLVTVLVEEAASQQSPRRRHAIDAIKVLIDGSMVHHITAQLATIEEAQFDVAKTMCLSLGGVIVRPLVEALSAEARPATRERLAAILVALGPVARRTVEQLKGSGDPVLRRTALYLLLELGGDEALPDVGEILNDTDPQARREALRSILKIGSDRAFVILEQALAEATPRSRDAIVQAICGVRDERATALFTHVVRHVDHRGALAPIYMRAVKSLGALRDGSAVAPLHDVLYRGEWWAPRRTAALRAAAAEALARIGTPDAIGVLEEACAHGSRGVRAAARAHLAANQRPHSAVGESRV